MDGICDLPIEDGGEVIVHYRSEDGSPAKGTGRLTFRDSSQLRCSNETILGLLYP